MMLFESNESKSHTNKNTKSKETVLSVQPGKPTMILPQLMNVRMFEKNSLRTSYERRAKLTRNRLKTSAGGCLLVKVPSKPPFSVSRASSAPPRRPRRDA